MHHFFEPPSPLKLDASGGPLIHKMGEAAPREGWREKEDGLPSPSSLILLQPCQICARIFTPQMATMERQLEPGHTPGSSDS